MSRWEEWQRARRLRDGQESEKRRGDGLPERRRRADRGGDEARGLNGRAYARGPRRSRARLTTSRGQVTDSGGQNLVCRGPEPRGQKDLKTDDERT